MWFRLVLLAFLAGHAAWSQTSDEDLPEFVGPPRPAQGLLLEPPPQFPIPYVPLLDQEFQAALGGGLDLDSLLPSPATILRSIFGFVLLLSLAFVAGHPRVGALERKLGIAHLATTGLPFVILGLIAGQRSIGVLSPFVLSQVAPLLTLGLGWVGFTIGYRFDARLMENLPRGIGAVVWFTTVIPFFTVASASILVMLALESGSMDRTYLRDAILLGIAGAMTAKSSPFLWRDKGLMQEDLDRMGRVVQLERIAGIVGLMLVTAYFRTDVAVVSWQLPPMAWLFITLGVGAAIGGLVHAILSTSRNDSESLVLLLGSISFAAGMAHYLRLSAISVCFLVGVVLANAPRNWRGVAESVVDRLERPVYFLFLLIAGAVWLPSDWRGWALMIMFVPARLLGKGIAAALVQRQRVYPIAALERQWLTFAPAGAISLAVVISAQNLYGGPRVSWIVTAVIAGSLANEVLVQLVLRRGRSATA